MISREKEKNEKKKMGWLGGFRTAARGAKAVRKCWHFQKRQLGAP